MSSCHDNFICANLVATCCASFRASQLEPVACADASVPPPFPLMRGTTSVTQALAVSPAAIDDWNKNENQLNVIENEGLGVMVFNATFNNI